jgi:hypothetical protein
MTRVLMLWLLSACGAKDEAPLVTDDRFIEVEASADPFLAGRSFPRCEATTFGPELLGGERSFGVNGIDCAYVTVGQPALVEVDEGDLLHVRFWHFALLGLDTATATVVLTVGGHPVMERFIPIPAESELFAPYFEAEFSTGAGAPVLFHVENHGSNSYNLVELTRGGDRPPEPR